MLNGPDISIEITNQLNISDQFISVVGFIHINPGVIIVGQKSKTKFNVYKLLN